jgi:hypothetical protein
MEENMASSFTGIQANCLDEVQMIAGDEQTFLYNIYNKSGAPINIELGGYTCSVLIFKYGNPDTIIADISGSISGSSCFEIEFSGSGLSGIYQQQVKLVNSVGKRHMPAQGKIVIFPSSE